MPDLVTPPSRDTCPAFAAPPSASSSPASPFSLFIPVLLVPFFVTDTSCRKRRAWPCCPSQSTTCTRSSTLPWTCFLEGEEREERRLPDAAEVVRRAPVSGDVGVFLGSWWRAERVIRPSQASLRLSCRCAYGWGLACVGVECGEETRKP